MSRAAPRRRVHSATHRTSAMATAHRRGELFDERILLRYRSISGELAFAGVVKSRHIFNTPQAKQTTIRIIRPAAIGGQSTPIPHAGQRRDHPIKILLARSAVSLPPAADHYRMSPAAQVRSSTMDENRERAGS